MSADTKQPQSARQIINAQRKLHAIVGAIFMVCAVVGVWYALVVLQWHEECVFLVVLGAAFLAFLQHRADVCPTCQRSISMLPSEGHLRVPELSHAIRCCPYCRADFSVTESLDTTSGAESAKTPGAQE